MRKSKEYSNFVGTQIGTQFGVDEINATNEAIKGMEIFKQTGENLLNVNSAQKQGNLFEYIEAAKFNINAARKGESIRAHVTAAEGNPHAAADILIKDRDNILCEVQAKSSNSASRATHMLSDSKYDGMQKLTNSNHADKVRELSQKRMVQDGLKNKQYADTFENVTGRLEYGDVQSSGTSYDEAMRAAENYDQYASHVEFQQFKREFKSTTQNAAIGGAVLRGAISAVRNSLDVYNDKKNVKEALEDTGKETLKGGLMGGATGALGTGIRIAAEKNGVALLSSSVNSISLAAGMIEAGVALHKYAKNEINKYELQEDLKGVGIKTISTVYVSSAIKLTLGVSGVLVPIAAYTLSSFTYKCCKSIIDNAKLSAKEAERITSIYYESIDELKKQRVVLQNIVDENIDEKKRSFNNLFNSLENEFSSNNYLEMINGLDKFVTELGNDLKLKNFDEFDQYMMTNDTIVL